MPAEPLLSAVSYDAYDSLLKTYVDAAGLVNYKVLKQNRAPLDLFVADLARIDPAALQGWERADRIAFWINAYNAITLVRIVDHYPIDRGGILASLRYPANSIRQIDGVWTKLTTPVASRLVTLDHIEHEILRKEFDEPRIHAAIVCAARGCPPLRAEAFRADQLDAQLDDQGRRFFGVAHRFRIDRDRKIVYLSPILSWFAEDFIKEFRDQGPVGSHNEKDSAALRFAMRYVTDTNAAYLATGDYRVAYVEYDWSLNEQEPSL